LGTSVSTGWVVDDGFTDEERDCDEAGHFSVRYEYGDNDEVIAARCEHCGAEVDDDL
jgi:hypothetical protein